MRDQYYGLLRGSEDSLSGRSKNKRKILPVRDSFRSALLWGKQMEDKAVSESLQSSVLIAF